MKQFRIASQKQSLSFSSALMSFYQFPMFIRNLITFFLYKSKKYLYLKYLHLFPTLTWILHYSRCQLNYTVSIKSNMLTVLVKYLRSIALYAEVIYRSHTMITIKNQSITICYQSTTIWGVLTCGCHPINGLK